MCSCIRCSINATQECADKTMRSLEALVHYLPGSPRDLPSLVEVLLTKYALILQSRTRLSSLMLCVRGNELGVHAWETFYVM